MSFRALANRFLRSKSGRWFLLYLVFCGVVSAAVGCGIYQFSTRWFEEHKSEEKLVALRLVDAFVTNYSAVRSQLGSKAPVPATFRAHSIESFSKSAGPDDDFRLRWVGREGRSIATPPSDADTAKTIEAFASEPDPKPASEFLAVGDELVFRTVYPSLAREQSCVDCHNALQPGAGWRLNDVMGAFVIDVPASPFLHSILFESTGLSLALFLALGTAGLAISAVHFRQMTEREAAAAEISSTRKFLHTVIEHMPAIVVVKDTREERYALFNRAAETLFGVSREDVIGKRVEELAAGHQAGVLRDGDRDVLESRALMDMGEASVDTPGLGTRILRTKKVPILGQDGKPNYLLTVSEDVTERARAEERVAHMAHHDILTGLPNRVAFSEQLANTIERQTSADGSFALLCLDLDRFKEVNDVFGHTVGDALLQEVARRMHPVLDGGFLARLGGDEFIVIANQGPHLQSAAAVADRLLAAVTEEMEIEGRRLRVGLSVGVAMFPADGADAATLLANANAALDRAKAEGRGAIRFFEAGMDLRLRESRIMQQELQSAIERNELYLEFQPQAYIRGEIVGFEALVRWRSPTRGIVPPGKFIPLAEESGLVVPIGEWILRSACREAASWPRPLHVAVNLSPVQFRHGDLPAIVQAILLETGLSASRLELEITEGVLIDDFSRAVSILRRLKLLGVRIAMDDFGTGYSSLSYLQAFPFDKIKIDRAFVSNLNQNPQSAAIIRAVIALGRGLDLPVVAEGVETKDQLAFLSREACDQVQGYLIGHPRSIGDYAEMVGRPCRSERIA